MKINHFLPSLFTFSKKIIQCSLVYYVLAVLIFFFIFDRSNANLLRLEFVEKTARYPVLFASKEAPFDERKFKSALFYCRKALENKPFFKSMHIEPKDPSFTLARIHGMMGFCYYYLDQQKKAIKYFDKVPKNIPDFYWRSYNLGIMAYEQKQYEQAVQYFNKALFKSAELLEQLKVSKNTSGKHADMMNNLHQIYFMLAREVYQNSQIFVVLSNYHSGNYQDTLTNASILFQRDNTLDKWFFYFYAALAAKRMENYPLAISLFRQAIAGNPDLADAYDPLSQCLIKTKMEGTVKKLLNYVQYLRSQKNYKNPLTKKQTIPEIQLDPWSYFVSPGKENFYLGVYGNDFRQNQLGAGTPISLDYERKKIFASIQ